MSEPVFLPLPDPETPAEPTWDEKRMTLIQHLEELRRRLIIVLIAYALASALGVAVSGYVITLIVRPLDFLHLHLSYFGPMDYFIIHFKVGAVVGLVLALPVILQQTWAFIAPGLRPVERRFAGPLLLSALLLFVFGAALSYFFLYLAIRVIGLVSHDSSLVFVPEANAYIGFVAVLMVVFGIAFEFPVALVIASMVGLVSSSRLRAMRKGAYFLIIVCGMVFTPGVDPITPWALIIPLLFLYEGSILVIRRMGK
jgi:sec-independent protein translocase protein TatC